MASVKREFRVKYLNTLLGGLWALISPLSMIVVYTVIFSKIMSAKLQGVSGNFAYSIYLCTGFITWGLFAEIANRLQNIFLDNSNLIKKIRFPKLCLPVVVVVSALLNFSIIFTIFTLFLVASGNFPGLAYLALLPLIFILLAFAIGLGLMLGILNVFFRDIGHFFGVFLPFWFWLTPIVYPEHILPTMLRDLMEFNPMATLMAGFQAVFVTGQWPKWISLLYPASMAALLCILSMRLFRRRVGEMVDEL